MRKILLTLSALLISTLTAGAAEVISDPLKANLVSALKQDLGAAEEPTYVIVYSKNAPPRYLSLDENPNDQIDLNGILYSWSAEGKTCTRIGAEPTYCASTGQQALFKEIGQATLDLLGLTKDDDPLVVVTFDGLAPGHLAVKTQVFDGDTNQTDWDYYRATVGGPDPLERACACGTCPPWSKPRCCACP